MIAANDNEPKIHRIGVGNERWQVNEVFGILSDRETSTVAKPLRVLQDLVAQALAMMRAEGSAERNGAIYVIGDVYGRTCKIGKASDPIARLAQLQTGNPLELFIHRVFWLRRTDMDEVELVSHRIAGSSYRRLQGEWFHCDPSGAHEAIERAIRRVTKLKSVCVMTPLETITDVAV